MGDLSQYRAKRDPDRTPEPFGGATDGGCARFVIQEHHARRLHYDVRLERDGVLVCWAVPRNLPDEPGRPRLAVHTEDHPVDYLDFHGEIPSGEYGGGSMTIWDHGHYETEKWSDDEVAVTLYGERTSGRFVFLRPSNPDRGRERDWLVQRRKTDTDRASGAGGVSDASSLTSDVRNATSSGGGGKNGSGGRNASGEGRTGSGKPSGGAASAQSPRVSVGGRALKLSNLDKELYPGVPKSSVIDYYARVADVLLPHLAGRPLTLRRFPDGIDAESFYEKNAGARAPEWLRTVEVPTPGSSRGTTTAEFVVVEELATLVYLANLAVLELHVPQWRVDGHDAVRSPDELVFDLDPGPGTTIVECCRVAARIRDVLAADGLTACPKTSGNKGMQLTAPVRVDDPGDTSRYAHEIARRLAREAPDEVVSVMAKDRRRGKVFVDWSQNNTAKTTVAPYSLRARAAGGAPTVSTPLHWAEVEACRSPDDLVFSPAAVLERIGADGDLYAPVLQPGPALPAPP